MAAATEPKGDIISTYPKMVSSYVVVQLVSYVCSLLSTFGVRGATATAVAAHLAPIETTLCQMMFMTTMHNGPVSDGRLINVCRVGFLIDGIVLFVGSATVFRPESVADAVAAVNLTAIGGTNSLYLESEPGAEDWHPLELSYGELQTFYGVYCAHFTAENTTGTTRASLDFRLVPGGCYETRADCQPVDFKVGGYYSEAAWSEPAGRWEVSVRGQPYWRHGFPHTNR